MAFWIAVILFVLITIFLSLNVKAEILFKLQEDEAFQGITLQINSRFYQMNRKYDYTDPNLRLLESILISAIENRKSHTGEQTSIPEIQEVFIHALKGFPVRSIISLSRDNFNILKIVLRYTFIENLEWKSTVGSRDALYTALNTGLCWSLKGILIATLSSFCKLRHLRLEVKPNFVTPAFFSNFSCILKMRMVHIIIIELYAIAIKVRWCINEFRARTAEPSH